MGKSYGFFLEHKMVNYWNYRPAQAHFMIDVQDPNTQNFQNFAFTSACIPVFDIQDERFCF